MKLAITGKGGVGKTTLAAILIHLFASEGIKVIAVDADPDANLAQALGISARDRCNIQPLSEMAELIEERTGARQEDSGGMYKLNPQVDDLMEKFGYKFDAITLIVMGRLKPAASGCYCPENVFLRRLLRHLVTGREEVVVVDMEAGIEHLTRGTAEAVDAFIVVVEPGQRSIQTARTVLNLAQDLGVKKVFAVGNKIRDGRDMRFLTGHLSDINFIGAIPLMQSLVDADMNGLSPYAGAPDIVEHVKGVKDHLKAA